MEYYFLNMWDKKTIAGLFLSRKVILMENLLPLIEKLIPEELDIFHKRYIILKTIYNLQPVGRRNISAHIGISERTVRGEVEKLKKQNLIEISKLGMIITNEGKDILNGLEGIIKYMSGLSLLEEKVKDILNVKQAYIVSGDSDKNENVKNEIGIKAGQVMLKSITSKSIIAVTGGSTMTCMVKNIPHCTFKAASLVVPARGIVGLNVEQQSDTLAAALAEKLNAQYRLLSFPDTMRIKTMNEIKNEPMVKDILKKIKEADTLVFGIGNAMEMAQKRRVTDEVYKHLLKNSAVSEAFGYYLNGNGEIVYSAPSICINFEDTKKIPCVIAVAGGTKKATSIISVCRKIKNGIIVMDEGAAKEILRIAGCNFG